MFVVTEGDQVSIYDARKTKPIVIYYKSEEIAYQLASDIQGFIDRRAKKKNG